MSAADYLTEEQVMSIWLSSGRAVKDKEARTRATNLLKDLRYWLWNINGDSRQIRVADFKLFLDSSGIPNLSPYASHADVRPLKLTRTLPT